MLATRWNIINLSHLVVILVYYGVVSNHIQLGENNKIHLPLFGLESKNVLKRTCTVSNRKSVAPYEQPKVRNKKKTVNLYITALYIVVTLHTTPTGQLS